MKSKAKQNTQNKAAGTSKTPAVSKTVQKAVNDMLTKTDAANDATKSLNQSYLTLGKALAAETTDKDIAREILRAALAARKVELDKSTISMIIAFGFPKQPEAQQQAINDGLRLTKVYKASVGTLKKRGNQWVKAKAAKSRGGRPHKNKAGKLATIAAAFASNPEIASASGIQIGIALREAFKSTNKREDIAKELTAD